MGQPVTFTVTVTNTGNVPLTVRVADPGVPACGMTIGGAGLAPGAQRSQSCTKVADTVGTLSNRASFTARPAGRPDGDPIAGYSNTVRVIVDPVTSSTPAPPPPAPHTSGGLAETGGSVVTPALIGGALVLLGGGALVLGRRREPGRPRGQAG